MTILVTHMGLGRVEEHVHADSAMLMHPPTAPHTHTPLNRGDFSQNRLASSVVRGKPPTKHTVDWLNTS